MADFHGGFKREDTGIHTVEGTVSGRRAASLAKKREAEQAEYEAKKRRIQNEYKRGAMKIDEKFGGSASDAYEAQFKARTVGLVTADEFRKAREDAEKAPKATGNSAEDAQRAAAVRAEDKKRRAKKKKALATLSFGGDMQDDDEDDLDISTTDAAAAAANGSKVNGIAAAAATAAQEAASTAAADASLTAFAKKKISKNPNVDTTFLPDREREALIAREKALLREEWLAEQLRLKQEMLEVTYSYWDGSGHRRNIKVAKGVTVGKFLEAVRQQLSADFTEMRSASSDNLLYIKEDLIIPHSYSFYDLIVTKARGKSGPLFHFDVHDDVRVIQDTRIEKDESHPGKVVERRWYERSKHIFPASRWEVYDPTKEYGEYTLHGKEVNAKEKR